MSTIENQGNTYELPLEAFLARINRHLKRLIPYRELFYDFGRRNYFIRVVNQGQPDHLETQGPYYYVQMVGLARMIGVLSRAERVMPSITLKTRGGSVYQEHALSSHLKFDVLTPVLIDAITALRGKGWTVQAPLTVPVILDTDKYPLTGMPGPLEDPHYYIQEVREQDAIEEACEIDIDPETGEPLAR